MNWRFSFRSGLGLLVAILAIAAAVGVYWPRGLDQDPEDTPGLDAADGDSESSQRVAAGPVAERQVVDDGTGTERDDADGSLVVRCWRGQGRTSRTVEGALVRVLVAGEEVSRGLSDSGGEIELDVTAKGPIEVVGELHGVTASMRGAYESAAALRQAHPDGVDLVFFFPASSFTYQIQYSGIDPFGELWIRLHTGAPPRQIALLERQGTLRHGEIVAPGGAGEMQAEPGVAWWLSGYDRFGGLVATCAAPFTLMPGEEAPVVLLNLGEESATRRLFVRIVPSIEFERGDFGGYIAFRISVGGRRTARIEEVFAGPGAAEADFEIPRNEQTVVQVATSLALSETYRVGSEMGVSPDQRLVVELSHSTSLRLPAVDYPELVGRRIACLLGFQDGTTGSAVGRSQEEARFIEVVGALGPSVRSIRVGDRLFLTRLQSGTIVTLPDASVSEVPIEQVSSVDLRLSSEAWIENPVEMSFYCGGGLWAVRTIYPALGWKSTSLRVELPCDVVSLEIRDLAGRRPDKMKELVVERATEQAVSIQL